MHWINFNAVMWNEALIACSVHQRLVVVWESKEWRRNITSIWLWRNLIYPIASNKTEAVSVCKSEICHTHTHTHQRYSQSKLYILRYEPTFFSSSSLKYHVQKAKEKKLLLQKVFLKMWIWVNFYYWIFLYEECWCYF